MTSNNANYLLSKIHSQEDISLFLDRWATINHLAGQQKAYEIFQSLIINKNLGILNLMSNEQILLQFSKIDFKQTKQQKLTNKWLNPQTTNKNKLAKFKKSIQQKKVKDPKNIALHQIKPYEIPDQLPDERQQTQLLAFLNQYRQYCFLSEKDIKNISLLLKKYQKNNQILDKEEIRSQVLSLRELQFSYSKQTSLRYLKIVDSALYYSSRKYRLRSTQIIAILLFLLFEKNKILLQILTGEGKSTTISCVAAILTISGKVVDIVTTSPLLAKRDVEQKEPFYHLMDIDVAHNFEQNQTGRKQCYEGGKIVYGTPHSFQVDILFDEYKKRQTRCERAYQILIVDEVDSMFVDQKDHQTLLSTVYPGFSELIYPMKIIWNKISTSVLYQEDNKIMMAISYGEHTATGPAKQAMKQIIKDIRSTFKNQLIPDWRMQFVNQSLEKWVQSAVSAAIYYKQKQHYVVKDGTIVPIDYKNTGCLQDNVHWENGLHQFLQIKHGLRVSTEGMTSNFISNLGHFDKYEYIFGLTGTLGSQQSKSFLKQTYKIDLMMEVPPFKKRRLHIEKGQVLYDQTQWAKYIVQQIDMMMACQRSVLVISESIQQVDLLKLALKKIKVRKIQVLQKGDESISDEIDCNQIILATNLAGRGTDLKVTEYLNEMGGLHVIIGFMPINLRVEMQGRGRAGRNGCKGSSELAVNYQRFCLSFGMKAQSKMVFENSIIKRVQTLQMIRDQVEKKGVVRDLKKVKELRCKDEIFQLYCQSVNKIPGFQKNHAKQLAIQQKWAMQLKSMQNRNLSTEQMKIQSSAFIKKRLVIQSQSHYNPNHQNLRGINQLCESNRPQAISHFKKAQQNTGTIPRIIGGLYQNVCQINQNPKDSNNINNCLKNLTKVQAEIKSRQELVNGLDIYDIENKNVVKFHQEAQRNIELEFVNKLTNKDIAFEPIKTFQKQAPLKKYQNSIGKADLASVKLQTGEARVLKALSDHIDQLKNKYQNLGEGEHITIQFRPISKILQNLNGDKKENQESLEKLIGEGLQLLPIPTVVKKKKTKWWKRVLVFILGVIQIIVGSIILASTCGALTNFGVTMMMEGAKDCYNSIFRPELINDLKAYFGQKVLTYTFSLAMSGMKGIKQLASLSKSGFQMMKNMPLDQFLSTTFKNVGQGMLKFPGALFSLEGGKSLMSQGLSSILSNKLNKKDEGLRQMIRDPVCQIKKKAPQLKKQIEQIEKKQQKKQIQLERIMQRFQRQLSKIISNLIGRLDQNILGQIKKLPINSQQIYIIISNSIKQKLQLPQGESKEAKAIIELFCSKIQDSRLAQYYAKHINLQKIIKKTLQSIKSDKNYQKWKQVTINNLVVESLQVAIEKRKNLISSKKQKLENDYNYLQREKNSNILTKKSYNDLVQKFQSDQQQFNKQVNNHNTNINRIPSIQAICKKIKQRSAINDQGQILVPKLKGLYDDNQLIKEALTNIRYTNSAGTFNQSMESAVYNEVVNFGLRIINEIKNSTEGIAEEIEKIGKKMRQ